MRDYVTIDVDRYWHRRGRLRRREYHSLNLCPRSVGNATWEPHTPAAGAVLRRANKCLPQVFSRSDSRPHFARRSKIGSQSCRNTWRSTTMRLSVSTMRRLEILSKPENTKDGTQRSTLRPRSIAWCAPILHTSCSIERWVRNRSTDCRLSRKPINRAFWFPTSSNSVPVSLVFVAAWNRQAGVHATSAGPRTHF